MLSKSWLLFLWLIVGVHGKCDNIYDSGDCDEIDPCSDIHENVNEDSGCHNSKLESLNLIKQNYPLARTCCSNLNSNDKQFMFKDECQERSTFDEYVCRKPNPDSDVVVSEFPNECPQDCTTNIRLLSEDNEFTFASNQFKLIKPYGESVYLHKYCLAYECGTPTKNDVDERWNIVARTCICLKKNKLDDLNKKIDETNSTRCQGSLSGSIKCSGGTNPLVFEDYEYGTINPLDHIIKVETFDGDYPIAKNNKNYCFGPSWTDDDDLVKTKLFYCEKGVVLDGNETENDNLVGIIVGGTVGGLAVIGIIVAAIVAACKPKQPKNNGN
jgi:hypothetical protein